MNIFDFQKNINAFDIEAEVVNTVETTGHDIARLIKTQLAFGITGENKPIRNKFTRRTSYSLWWGEYRTSLGLQTDFFDLKVTGEFTSKIGVFAVTPEDFAIYSTSVKTYDLEKMFGESILNLTDDSRREYIDTAFFPELKYRIENKLGVKFV